MSVQEIIKLLKNLPKEDFDKSIVFYAIKRKIPYTLEIEKGKLKIDRENDLTVVYVALKELY